MTQIHKVRFCSALRSAIATQHAMAAGTMAVMVLSADFITILKLTKSCNFTQGNSVNFQVSVVNRPVVEAGFRDQFEV